jgi:hypothetical protein
MTSLRRILVLLLMRFGDNGGSSKGRVEDGRGSLGRAATLRKSDAQGIAREHHDGNSLGNLLSCCDCLIAPRQNDIDFPVNEFECQWDHRFVPSLTKPVLEGYVFSDHISKVLQPSR